MKEILERIKQIVLQKEKMLLLVLTGILIFVACIPVKKKTDIVDKQGTDAYDSMNVTQFAEQSYKKEMEQELTQLLGNMEGVGRVQVMITLKSSGQKILAKDEPHSISTTNEEDAEGGVRSIEQKSYEETTIYGKDAMGSEMPYIIEQRRPEIEGVFIIAEGGGEDNVRLQITEAVQALFGIEAHKIKVARRKI